jgi:Zn-dependent protease
VNHKAAAMALLDTANFAETLQILRDYPHPSKSKGKRAEGTEPAFSGKRVLRFTLRAVLVTGWLFAVCMLLAIEQSNLAVLLLAAGLITVAVSVVRSRRRTLATDVTNALPATIAAGPGPTNDLPPTRAAGDPPAPESSAPEAVSAKEFQPAADLFPLRPEPPPINTVPASRLRRFLVFAVSLALYAAIAVWSLPDLTTTWIVLTVLFHEAGHFVAMYLRGYSNLNMFFIPFIAGAVTGEKKNASPADQLIMLLAGPTPGLLIGCLIYWLDALHPIPAGRPFTIWLVALNLLNLLPIWPLDGGRICWILFARQSALTQAVLSACSFVGLFFLLFVPQGGTTFLFLMSVLLIGWLPERYRHARAALAFFNLYPDAPAELKQLSEQQLWTLYCLAEPAKADASGTRAMQMMNIYSRVSLLPRSAAKLRYLLAFILLWLITLATAAGTSLQFDARRASAALGTLFDVVMSR